MPDCPVVQIAVIGSLNVDFVTRTSRLPAAGETLTATSFSTGFGGKGANQAISCARLSRTQRQAEKVVSTRQSSNPPEPTGEEAGKETQEPTISKGKEIEHSQRGEDDDDGDLVHKDEEPDPDVAVEVLLVGAVGMEDAFHKDFFRKLEADNVRTNCIREVPGKSTGTATIIVEESTGENRILICAGANADVNSRDVDAVLLRQMTVNVPTIIVLQLELPLPTVLHALNLAHSQGIETVLNPAPAVSLPASAYPCITHLILNETEAWALSGIEEQPEPPLTLRMLCDKVVDIFLERGVTNVIITLGEKGVFYKTKRKRTPIPTDLIPAVSVANVVDTTAAGDTFVGAYSVARVQAMVKSDSTFDIRAAVEFANQAAAVTVQKQGASVSIPWLNEVPSQRTAATSMESAT